MMESSNPNKAWMLAAKWAAFAGEVDYMRERLDLNLLMEGVRYRHDVPGDKLGGALEHLSASLETLAHLIDPDTGEDED